MLEWYRVGFDHHQLMDEMDALLRKILNCQAAKRSTYQAIFIEQLKIDPLTCNLADLQDLACAQGFSDIAQHETDRDTLLQLLFSMCIEPQIGQDAPHMVYDFPASQAALARINPQDARVAERFEVYYKGIELANGFHELQDAQQQRLRFEQDNAQRRTMGLPEIDIDERLLAALEYGLPDCAGVALGGIVC